MKKLLTFLAIATSISCAYGEEITPDQAIARAFAGPHRVAGILPQLETTPVYTSRTDVGSTVAYVFNSKSNGGYYILSANDLAYPILGYADNGSFNPDEMPPAMEWWLSEYGRQIEFAASKNARVAQNAPVMASDNWEAVEPMLSTKWNQDAPYNNDCPPQNGETCVTGCVATSMAQLMNYFKYPEVGEGSIQYTSSGRRYSMDFSRKPFDWDNMLDTYSRGKYNEEEAAAVAYLMKACGFSTKMQYSTSMSGTQGELIASALRTYFKYDGNCRSEVRLPYSWNEWSTMIYDNLKNVGPVVINGASLYGGHSFVCDGYDGNGYFHFNWGWGGVSDGYYALDALNPDAQGIGGYAGGYNFSQDAIIGAQKPTGDPIIERPFILTQYGATVATINSLHFINFNTTGSSMLGWGNTYDEDIRVKVGAIFEPVDGGESVYVEGKIGNMGIVTLSPGTYIPAENGNPIVKAPDLPDGTYKAILASQDTMKEDAPWLPVIVEWSYPNYCYLYVDNGEYRIENVDIPSLTFGKAEILSDVYYGCNFKLCAEISNDSDIELTQGVSPVFKLNDKTVYNGQSILVTLQPGEKKNMEWISKVDEVRGGNLSAATEFEWGLENPQTSKMYGDYGKVVVNPSPGNMRVSMSTIGIENVPTESMTIDDSYFAKVFIVEDLSDFVFNLDFKVSSGYFDGQLIIDLCEVDVLGQFERVYEPIGEPLYQEYPFLAVGSSFNHNQKLSIPDGEDDKLYSVRVRYSAYMQLNELGQVFLMKKDPNSVDSIMDSNEETIYYNLQGVRVKNPLKGDLLIMKQGAKTQKIIF